VFILLKNGEVYTPDYIGKKDILICHDRILKIDNHIDFHCSDMEIKTIDATDFKIVPGFIDQHVHFTGGGGEGGPVTRTPEIMLTTLTTAGITTALGLLGTDGITRSVEALLAKAKALEKEGISTYIYSGCYSLPTRTVTGSIRSDLVLIDKVVGSGEIAISDHRSSQPSIEDLKKLAAETRLGGILSNKCGIVHLHLGDGKTGLNPLIEIVNTTEVPIKQFMPSHINRISHLVEHSMAFIRLGGYVDLTSGIYPTEASPKSLSIADTLNTYIKNNISLDHVCASSDGNGSLPEFDSEGNLISIGVGSPATLFKDIKAAINSGIVTLEQGIKLITVNPAKALKLYPQKGALTDRSDADLVLLDNELNIHTVIARGQIMVQSGQPIVKGYFEG
jgi:beta-aspartyl-dipeptidase (metallo-type)